MKVLGKQLDNIVEELKGIKLSRDEIGERIKVSYNIHESLMDASHGF